MSPDFSIHPYYSLVQFKTPLLQWHKHLGHGAHVYYASHLTAINDQYSVTACRDYIHVHVWKMQTIQMIFAHFLHFLLQLEYTRWKSGLYFPQFVSFNRFILHFLMRLQKEKRQIWLIKLSNTSLIVIFIIK